MVAERAGKFDQMNADHDPGQRVGGHDR